MLLAPPVHQASIPCPHRKDHGGQSYQSLCALSDALGYWLTNPSGLPWPQPPLRLDCSISCQFHALGRTTHPAPSCLSGHPPASARPAPRPVHRREAPALRDESLTENALEEWIEPSARMDLVASDPLWAAVGHFPHPFSTEYPTDPCPPNLARPQSENRALDSRSRLISWRIAHKRHA